METEQPQGENAEEEVRAEENFEHPEHEQVTEEQRQKFYNEPRPWGDMRRSLPGGGG